MSALPFFLPLSQLACLQDICWKPWALRGKPIIQVGEETVMTGERSIVLPPFFSSLNFSYEIAQPLRSCWQRASSFWNLAHDYCCKGPRGLYGGWDFLSRKAHFASLLLERSTTWPCADMSFANETCAYELYCWSLFVDFGFFLAFKICYLFIAYFRLHGHVSHLESPAKPEGCH